MTEPKHIGWLNTEPRCKVWECDGDVYETAKAHGGVGGPWTYCQSGLIRPGPNTDFGEAVYIRAVDVAEIREWPEFTPVEKMDECDLCKTPIVRGDSYPQTDERGTRQVCKKCFAGACGMKPTPGGVSDDGPTGETADALRGANCTYVGIKWSVRPDGTLLGAREPGDVGHHVPRFDVRLHATGKGSSE